ncbi:class I SAM-dependent methyltransferase [Streptomyces phaeofaciens JCM 4814]|uniref:Ubiquinone/menaquinone biosynthesis methyltransferase n=1 Tax=Streptomyces phaeofaciens TaxID=68254 RepID=A0A918HG81_9ACTN|nr:class I SAM-dependent methyltransferase [Streptomyces phaeofaciens]GGT59819.1 ubiquinone/menaquinone biosynthesis methyltransferase [Streptomyces phaeofaciens]
MADVTGFHLKGSAPERYEHYVAPLMAPFVTALVDAADLFPGATVLDLACGTGFAARTAAAQAGPTGRVAGADLNEGMLKIAVACHPRLYPDIEFTPAPADDLPYSDATFDAVLCQQGAQFFPDLDAALRETARVTRPGGRFAATVWSDLDDSPYFVAQYKTLGRLGGPEATEAYRSAFHAADRITTALTGAGYRAVNRRELTFAITLPPLEDYIPGHLSAIPWGQEITETAGEQALTEAARAIRAQLPEDTTTFPFTATLVTATR